METDFQEPRPASDTVEILPTPAVEEAEPALVEARTLWPVETGIVAIETASLPALAGEAGESVASPPPQLGPAEAAPFAAADEGHGRPQLGPAEAAPRATADEEHGRPQLEPAEVAPVAAADEDQGPPPTAEAEPGVPYISEAERQLETASAAAEPEPPPRAQSQPPHPVQTVTEKPANPRRGWWQRLLQP